MGEAKHRVGIFGNMLNFLQERSTKDGQTRQKLLLAFNYFGKNEIKKKGVEKDMLKAKKKENYEAMIENRNVLIADLQKEIVDFRNENIAVYEENKELRFENEEQKDLINRIEKLATSNTYNNEKAVLSKIKELISDYQSQN